MTSRVAAAIDAARAEGRGVFVGYLPLGFPDLQTSIDAAVTLAENGADILELGPPYSDPVMDGAIIQEATQAALAGGFRMRDTFTAVREIARRVDVPVLVMTYWNPVAQYGVDRYADDLLAAGGAGLITPDITPEAAEDWIAASTRTGLDRVFLAAPTSTDERLELIVRSTTGFVYTVSTMGITGERAQLDAAARTLVGRLRGTPTRRPTADPRVRRHRHLHRRAGHRCARLRRRCDRRHGPRPRTARRRSRWPRRDHHGPLRRVRRAPPRLLTSAPCRRSPLEGPA